MTVDYALMKAVLSDKPFSDPDWVFDGWREIARRPWTLTAARKPVGQALVGQALAEATR
jgi:hypothetical protein